MADIERTLELEPHHLGTLSGIAQIMAATNHDKLALQVGKRVLAIFPMLHNA